MNLAPRLLAAPTLLWLAGCGGNVVVDGSGASTTTLQTTTLSTSTGTTGSNDCAGVDPTTLSPCGGTTEGSGTCDLTYCDAQSNTWEEVCADGFCKCLHNGAPVCTCSMFQGDPGCTDSPGCCFGK
jgi:hypothetical protein